MAASVSFIKNPLTIIGVFASLVETGGLAVLPFIDREIQLIYIWFLMLFPTFLVGAFFVVLYKKHIVLYAPSDYKDDVTFADMGSRMFAATTIQIREKQVAEVRELQVGVPEQTGAPQSPSETASQPIDNEPEHGHGPASESKSRSSADDNESPPSDEQGKDNQAVPSNLLPVLAEKWALDLLGEKYKIPFVREIAFHLGPEQLTFDAGIVSADSTTIVEVRTARSNIDSESYLGIFGRVERLYYTLDSIQRKNFVFIFAVVAVPRAKIQFKKSLSNHVDNLKRIYKFNVQIEFIDWEELEYRNSHLLRRR